MKNNIAAVVILVAHLSVYANQDVDDSGLIINDDCCHFLSTRPEEKMTVEGLQEHVDVYAQTQVSQIFFNVNAQCTCYPSNVWESYWDNKKLDDLKGELKWIHNAVVLNKKGIDLFEVRINRCREKNISPWISIRMNDIHNNNDISHYIHSQFWREHPEYWRVQGKSQKGYYDRAYDYGHKEVRDYYMALIQEVLERYDADGIELDWLREPFCFRPGHEKAGLTLLTEFTRQVRDLTNSWAVKRAHPIKIAARVPVHPETAKGFGFDVITWCKMGLVDMVVLSPRWRTTDFDIPVELWRELLGQTAKKVKIVACLEQCIKPSYAGLYCNAGVIQGTYESLCGFSAAMLDRGADQIYLYNHFDYDTSIAGPEVYHDALSNCGQLETVIDKPRRNIVTWPDVFPPGVPVPHLLPAELKPWKETEQLSIQQFRIYTGPKPTQGRVIIRVGFEKSDDIEKGKLAASVNSTSCSTMDDHDSPEQFHSARVAQFDVPLDAMQQGYNLIEVAHMGGGGTQKIVWVETYYAP